MEDVAILMPVEEGATIRALSAVNQGIVHATVPSVVPATYATKRVTLHVIALMVPVEALHHPVVAIAVDLLLDEGATFVAAAVDVAAAIKSTMTSLS